MKTLHLVSLKGGDSLLSELCFVMISGILLMIQFKVINPETLANRDIQSLNY